jgi:Rad3-related DNA helicase
VSEPITTEDWLDFFPPTPEGVRPDQEKAINSILNHFAAGVQNMVLQGGTGNGKTFIAWTVANFQAAQAGWRTRVLVPNRFLAEQYVKDFAPLGLVQLHSSEHYDCPGYVSCDQGRGNELVRVEVGQEPEAKESAKAPECATGAPGEVAIRAASEAAGTTSEMALSVPTAVAPELAVMGGGPMLKTINKPLCDDYDHCPYLEARTAFSRAAIAVTNASYAFTCARYNHEFVCGDLIVLDEAHTVGDRICQLYEISVPLSRGNGSGGSGPLKGQELDWIRHDYIPEIQRQISKVEAEILRKTVISVIDPELPKLQRRHTGLSATLNNLFYLAMSSAEEWVIDRQEYKRQLIFRPLWARRLAPALLDFLAPRRLLMSATILDYTKQLSWLGLD